jgi:hypothetical protein
LIPRQKEKRKKKKLGLWFQHQRHHMYKAKTCWMMPCIVHIRLKQNGEKKVKEIKLVFYIKEDPSRLSYKTTSAKSKNNQNFHKSPNEWFLDRSKD